MSDNNDFSIWASNDLQSLIFNKAVSFLAREGFKALKEAYGSNQAKSKEEAIETRRKRNLIGSFHIPMVLFIENLLSVLSLLSSHPLCLPDTFLQHKLT
jgi:hypothetical protein